jgi:hypothetical protein
MKENATEINLKVPEKFKIQGARLQSLTQAQTYRLIIRKKKKEPGGQSDTTQINLMNIQDELERTTGDRPTKENIWKKLSTGKINRKIEDFIWKMIHNRIKCGFFFRFIEELRDRQYCKCGEIETPEHIMLYCEKYETGKTWKHIEETWKKTSEIDWIQPTKGIIMGLPAIKLKQEEKQSPNETQRIFDNIENGSTEAIDEWKEAIERHIKTDFDIIEMRPFSQRTLHYANFKDLWCARENLAIIEEAEGKKPKLTIKNH